MKNNVDSCDIIYYRDGTSIDVKIIEIYKPKITYKKCENLEGQTYVVYKNEVQKINYANDTFAVVGFIVSLISLIIFGIPMGVLSVILGILAKNCMIKKNSRGKVLALLAIIIGFLDIFGVLLYLSKQ